MTQDEKDYQDYLDYQEYLQNQESDSPISLKGIGKASLEALPTAGGVFGGALGLASPLPGGAIGGAALGAYLGKALENVGEKYLLDEEKNRENIYLEPAVEAASAASGEAIAPIIGKSISGAGRAIGKGLKKTVSAFSSVPEKAIETYMDRPNAVKNIGKLSEETGIQDAADSLRGQAQASITDFKNDINDEIGFILMDKGDRLVNVSEIKNAGKRIISKLDPKIKEDALEISEIQKMIDQITDLQINPKLPFANASRVQRIKQVLQDSADYTADGLIKQKKGIADQTFKNMAREARKAVESIAPEIKQYNQKLSRLHNINKNINKNLISPEKTAASVMGVGSGQNQQAIKQMRKLEDLTGFDYVGKAEDIASAVHFNDPSIMPTVGTGRAAVPMAGVLGAATSFGAGNLPGALGSLGVSSLGSPMAIKAGMDAIHFGKKIAKPFSPLGGIDMAKQMLKSAIQNGVQPFMLEQMIKTSESLSNTEKAQLRQEAAKAAK